MREIELKFLVPDYKISTIQRQTHIKSAITSQLSAHYFDNLDETLGEHGIAIRIRQDNDNWVQTLKTAGDGIASRLEYNHQLDAEIAEKAYQEKTLQPDLSLYKKTPLKKFFKQLTKSGQLIINSPVVEVENAEKPLENEATENNESTTETENKPEMRSLLNLFSTEMERTTRLINKDDTSIEVAFDRGHVIHGIDNTQTQPIQEIEFELLQGDSEFLFSTAKTWCKRYQLCLSTISKAEKGSLLLQGRAYPEPVKSKLNALILKTDVSQDDFLKTVVHNCLLQILPNASAITAGSIDGEHVHQLRVGIRRLRTALKFFADFSDDVNPQWVSSLQETFALLGEYRDREILQIETQPMLEKLGSPKVGWEMDIRLMPIDAVRANDFQLTLLELIEFITPPTKAKKKSKQKLKLAKPQVSKVLDELFTTIVSRSEDFAQLTHEEKHDLRKQLKELRYLVEFATPLFAEKVKKGKKETDSQKALRKFNKRLKFAQEILGHYHDNLVAYHAYKEKAETEPNAYFAVGWLLASKQKTIKDCQKSLKKVRKAKKFW